MIKIKTFGWSPSKIDGTESKFEELKNFPIPEQYSYVNYLPPVENQGSTNMCVTYALAAHLDWNCNVDNGYNNQRNNHIDKNNLYAARSRSGDSGMTFKEALKHLVHKGVKSDQGIIKIEKYAMVKSLIALKQALLLNGPCVAGLFVRDPEAYEFWKGKNNYGGHAIAIVGYNKDGFIIRNSWGTRYGEQGYALLRYQDFDKILECWTIVD